ncbi:MAG TPA: hypothetical protein VGO61_14150 [Steroidobacteraceae bacterium]|jgi:hypothetical protein|nr:hypothetical protein [Steroidobacteraceae bacterium]
MKKIRMLALIACGIAASASIASTGTSESKPQSWDAFWRAHNVNPPPPRNFMGSLPANLKVLNMTNGAIDDAAARRWAEAALRRGQADRWAECNLRLDLVNSGVLGPPGLNGTGQFVENELANGTKSLSCNPSADVEKIAVIHVTEDMRRKHPDAHLTPYVIVFMSRVNGSVGTRTRSDGSQESLPTRLKKGEMAWQLDIGQIRDNPAIGQLWYQANGFGCRADGSTPLDDICALVKP